jgi:S-adenosylmethionine:tRNA ribosyltransferase-isomerase
VLAPASRILFAPDLSAEVESVSLLSPRAVSLRFDRSGDALWSALYRHGRPVQYAHEVEPIPLARFQTPYASRPWAAEMPSAGRPLRLEWIRRLARRGVRTVEITHAAGLSSTGDPAIDHALPLPERYDVPPATADAIRRAREAGGRVVAVGTSVVRALEGSADRHGGDVVAGEAETDLVIRRGRELRVVVGLLSGIHASDSSHFALLEAFLPEALAGAYAAHVVRAGYREHEFGDSTLVLSGRRGTAGGHQYFSKCRFPLDAAVPRANPSGARSSRTDPIIPGLPQRKTSHAAGSSGKPASEGKRSESSATWTRPWSPTTLPGSRETTGT